MSALDEPHDREVRPPERNTETEVRVQHGSEQTLLAFEVQGGSIVAAVDVRGIQLQAQQDLAQRLERAIQDVVTGRNS